MVVNEVWGVRLETANLYMSTLFKIVEFVKMLSASKWFLFMLSVHDSFDNLRLAISLMYSLCFLTFICNMRLTLYRCLSN